MEIVEIRDLDGPNLFLRRPAIKLEIDSGGGDPVVAEAFASAFVVDGELRDRTWQQSDVSVPATVLETLLVETVNTLHDRAGSDRPEIVARHMEAPGHTGRGLLLVPPRPGQADRQGRLADRHRQHGRP